MTDPALIDIETSTYAFGSRSLAVTGPNTTSVASPGGNPSFKPLTLSKNYSLIGSFEECNTYDDVTASGWTANAYDGIDYEFYSGIFHADLTAYNCLSLWAKAAETSSVLLTVEAIDRYNNLSSKSVGKLLDTNWKRYDFEIMLPTTSFDITSVHGLRLGINGDARAKFWIDDVFLFDLRTVSNRSSWIPINTGDMNESVATPFSDAGGPGLYGGINYIGKPDNQKMEIKFLTNAAYQDDEISFMDTAKKSGRELYLRAGRDGFAGYITNIQSEMRDTYKGLQRRGTLYMTQEMN